MGMDLGMVVASVGRVVVMGREGSVVVIIGGGGCIQVVSVM